MTYEFHGWFNLRLSPRADDDVLWDRRLDAAVKGIEPLVRKLAEGRTSIAADIRWLNGEPSLDISCMLNHRASDIPRLDALLDVVNTTMPGSFGILYEWSDDQADLPSNLEYSVRVMTRGQLTRHKDPFLSPIIPVVEDADPLT